MSQSMRGLTVFIGDLRACKSKESEQKRINKELANIRSKFKYVDFGHMEAVNLLASSKYTEKQIGYLAISVMLNEDSDLVRLIIQSIKNDLLSRDVLHVGLALACLANIGGREMAESLASEVQKLLVSSDSPPPIKKKAALCLLRLFRKYPDTMPAGEWGTRIVSLLDSPNIGVVTAVLSLLLSLIQREPNEFASCVPRAVSRLHKIVSQEDQVDDYMYYQVPAPWTQIKILRLLQIFPPIEDASTKNKLTQTLHKILSFTEQLKNGQHNNARNAILFEAINLVIYIESETELLAKATELLGRFISAQATNLRYLGLETMSHLASASITTEALKVHQDTVIASLQEKDISVRRRAVDLLYSMCDKSNSKRIVEEMLKYLEAADYAIREELVLKVAILAEKFAQDYTWYVDVMIQLIQAGGESVSPEVWHRVVQIIVNREEVQEYATRTLFNALQAPNAGQILVRLGGYVIGEFGHLIANEPGCSPQAQVDAINLQFYGSSYDTKAVLLTTYVKLVNLFPEMKGPILNLLQSSSQMRCEDVELQQRASEYFNLVASVTDDVLQAVLEEMPPFAERESSVLAILEKRNEHITDKTWQSGNKDISADSKPETQKSHSRRRSTSNNAKLSALADEAAAQAQTRQNVASDLLGLVGPTVASDPSSPSFPTNAIPTSDGDKFLSKFAVQDDGVLFESNILQIGIRSEFHSNLGRLLFFYGNKSQMPFSGFTTVVQSSPSVKIVCEEVSSTLDMRAQTQQTIKVECIRDFKEPPLIHVSFFAGHNQTSVTLRLPLFISKFSDPVNMTQADFFSRWKTLGGTGMEAQNIFKATCPIDHATVRKKLKSFGLSILENIDPNPENFVCASIIRTTETQIGVLLRLEPSKDAGMYRLTFRTSRPEISSVLKTQLSEHL